MFQRGIVSQIEGSQIVVAALSERDEESGCSTGGCGSGCSCNVTGQYFRALNTKDLPLEEGDKVEVTTEKGSVGIGLFLVFGLPILLGYAFWRWLPSFTGGTSQGWMAAAGVVLGLGAAILLGTKGNSQPEISTIL